MNPQPNLLRAMAAALVLLGACSSADAAVFQYRVPVRISRANDAAPRHAFLWIPPRAERIRGAVVCGMTLMEQHLVKDRRIRAACTDERLAIVFMTCGIGAAHLQEVLDDLARRSGYQELREAPLMFVGHSAGGPQALHAAATMPERCFGLVQYRGGTPGGEDPLPPDVPALVMLGQFDEFGGTMRHPDGSETWQHPLDAVAALRAADPGKLVSVVVEPGAGHFAWSERNAAYLATFLRKAARARIGEAEGDDSNGPTSLRAIDPTQGWLTSLDLRGNVPSGAWSEYRGDKSKTSWHFDRQMAEATIAYHRGLFGKRDQFVEWEDPHWVDAGARFFFTNVRWVGDGRRFEVHPTYSAVYPSQYNGRGPRWPRAGQPAGNSATPIRLKVVGGPLAPAGPRAFRVRHDALSPAGGRSRATFMAFSEGDDVYRYTELVGMMPRGFRGLDKGTEQTITFPAVADLKTGAGPVTLKATSDAGLPIDYYVAYGPAETEGNKLVIRELPARARFPVEVEVVAWQFGRGIEPRVKTAVPVARRFRITGP